MSEPEYFGQEAQAHGQDCHDIQQCCNKDDCLRQDCHDIPHCCNKDDSLQQDCHDIPKCCNMDDGLQQDCHDIPQCCERDNGLLQEDGHVSDGQKCPYPQEPAVPTADGLSLLHCTTQLESLEHSNKEASCSPSDMVEKSSTQLAVLTGQTGSFTNSGNCSLNIGVDEDKESAMALHYIAIHVDEFSKCNETFSIEQLNEHCCAAQSLKGLDTGVYSENLVEHGKKDYTSSKDDNCTYAKEKKDLNSVKDCLDVCVEDHFQNLKHDMVPKIDHDDKQTVAIDSFQHVENELVQNLEDDPKPIQTSQTTASSDLPVNEADCVVSNFDLCNASPVHEVISGLEDSEPCTSGTVAVSEDSEEYNKPATVVQVLSVSEAETRCCDRTLQSSNGSTTESSLIANIRELRNELVGLSTDIQVDDLGLNRLFSENRKKAEKSRSAKKRKKQQQKLLKSRPVNANSSSKFAQCAEELVFGREVEVEASLTCPVCLELYYLPHSCIPCGHIFCDPCLRRLTTSGWQDVPCPLCRTIIQNCLLQQEFDHIMKGTHPDVYAERASLERRSKFRYYKLPYTPPVPLGRRIIRHLRTTARQRQPDANWMSHDWFKFLLGCTVGVCTSMLIMLLNRVKSINDVRDVNIMFLSLILGASLTIVVFKWFKI